MAAKKDELQKVLLDAEFVLERETKGALFYLEQGDEQVARSLYLRKDKVPRPFPERIHVYVETV